MMLVAVSLFAGVGGFDLALRKLGVDTVVACEIDVRCQVVLRHHFPDTFIHGDIRTLTAKIIKREIKKRYGRKSVGVIVVGGFPCQPFSQAGQQGGTDDPRHLWPEMSRIVREMQPLCVVAENVPGMLGDKFAMAFEGVCSQMEATGLEVQAVDIPASSLNAPHIRQRVFFVANARNGGCEPKPIHRQWSGKANGPKGKAEGFVDSCEVRDPAKPERERLRKEGQNPTNTAQRLAGSNGPAPLSNDFKRGQQLQLFGNDRSRPWEEPDRGDAERNSGNSPIEGLEKREQANGRAIDQESETGLVAEPERLGSNESGDNPDTTGGRQGAFRDAQETQGPQQCDLEFAGLHGGEGLSGDAGRLGREGRLGKNRSKKARGHAGIRNAQFDYDGNGTFWQNFPTESPIFDRNDGFSVRLDIERVRAACRPTRKSITEAEANNSVNVFGLHAAGNAVVVQQACVVLRALFESNGWLGKDGKMRKSI